MVNSHFQKKEKGYTYGLVFGKPISLVEDS